MLSGRKAAQSPGIFLSAHFSAGFHWIPQDGEHLRPSLSFDASPWSS